VLPTGYGEGLTTNFRVRYDNNQPNLTAVKTNANALSWQQLRTSSM
jgi:hypothetical protein